MLDKVLETIEKNRMLKAGDKVICAVSGGADSMALLCALYEIKEKLKIEVYAAHVNHCIRGMDAHNDYQFVKDFCEKKGIELFYKKVDVPQLSRERHQSEETVGREERYSFFNQLSQKLGGAKIATGHHMNDNAETVLFNLFRGSSTKGLGGIPYQRGNIIRPLLDISRCETEAFLKNAGISWCEDKTNLDCTYSRNAIRNLVIKDIEKLFPEAVRKIAQCSESVKADCSYLDHLAEISQAYKDGAIVKESFEPLDECIRRRVCVRALKEWGVEEIDSEKIKAVSEIVLGATGKSRDVGNNVCITNSYGKVYKKETAIEASRMTPIDTKTQNSLEIRSPEGVWSIKTVDKMPKMRDNKMMIFLDSDKLGREVFVRQRQDGDFICPKGMLGTKKLKKVFIDLKIPREKRDRISMLTMGSEVLFIPGIRKTGNYLPDENTKKILIAEY
ncbi:MAG: tRNA lysidine(34) synthetase TilS, partial [Clostridia bacterium]|nr:tRNA lysidine(34) synthetase TilS [Clostridia bacterium]